MRMLHEGQDYGPVLARGGMPPGRWSTKPDGTQGPWEGDWSWRTPHGASTLCWHLGRPLFALDVGHAGGTLPSVHAIGRDGAWRRPAGDVYAHGVLEVRDDGISFLDRERAPFAPKPMPAAGMPPDLEADLGRDAAFLGLVLDDAFAAAVCDRLRNRLLVRPGTVDRPWLMAWGRIAGMVAAMRDRGEIYTDWHPYPRDTTPEAVEAFEDVLARLDWRDLTSEDAALHARLLADLMAEVDARPAGPCPDWAAGFGVRDGNEPYDRMARAAVEGRITRAEWGRVIDLHATVMDAIVGG